MSAPLRPLSLGIDTGGTYTDAVLYDYDADQLLAKAKSATTHDDLAIGITGALDAVLAGAGIDPTAIGLVALSTTLATNALVEGQGRPAGLVMIGFGEEALDRAGLRRVVDPDDVVIVGGGHTSHGDEAAPLDFDALAAGIDEVAPRVEAFAVTSQFGVRNSDHELAARDLIRERTGLPVTCSHELSDGLNGPKRSVTAVLNAGLIALIDELVATTALILEQRGIDAPIMVVRGNGSLVSSAFVRERPVETILSGPAASLVGGAHLVGARDAIIADIGGTTTDIAVIRDGMPEFGPEGATVGGHQTMVEAVLMHTHGFGGDSEVRLADSAVGAELLIGPRRVVPLVLAAGSDQEFLAASLARQIRADTLPGERAGLFVRRTARAADASLDQAEREIMALVGDAMAAVDEIVDGSLQARALRRLAARGVLRLSGFTPTDASHALGAQKTHDPAVAVLGADLLSRRVDRYGRPFARSPEEFCERVVVALVRRSAEALLAAAFVRDDLPADAAQSRLVAAAIEGTAHTANLVVGLAVPLIALGAPAATYYPAVGKLLGATVQIPEHADVANAIGAVVGKVRIRRQVTVTTPRRGIFRVHTGPEPETVSDLDLARTAATDWGKQLVTAEMVAAGAPEFEFETFWEARSAEVEGRELFVEGTATVIASGRPKLD